MRLEHLKKNQRTFLYILLLLALLTLLVVSSYTWFSLSRTPRVSDMEVYISGQSGLKLAAAYNAPEEEWDEILDFSKIVGDNTELKPATWSEARQTLLTADYGSDGRLLGSYSALTDERNANRSDDAAYYVKGTFYAKTDAAAAVSLAEAVEVNDGTGGAGTYVIGTPVWSRDQLVHYNGGMGAETAIRIGLRVRKIDPSSGASEDNGTFYIYEPNYDNHIGSASGELATPSIDGTPLLTASERLIRQTASTWTEANPVLSGVTIKQLGRFDKELRLFTILPNEIYAIDLYVWLEGQDADCTNLIEDARIIANIQFAADYSGQTGLVDIPN